MVSCNSMKDKENESMKNTRKYETLLIILLFVVAFNLELISSSSISGQEINLNEDYTQAIENEGDLYETEILYTINKWHYELFPGNRRAVTPFTLACLLDPWAYQLADSVRKEIEGLSVPYGQIAAINGWMRRNLLHTQGSGVFSGLPGDDPWGIMNSGSGPTYKKLLPSEMEAMSVYTGNIMGKCYTLANLIVTLMVLLDVDPDNIIVYQIWVGSYQHAIALAGFENELILFDNASATWVDSDMEDWIQEQRCFGFFNHFTARGRSFRIDEEFFDREETLFELTVEASGVRPTILNDRIDLLYQFGDREDLVSNIFLNEERSDMFALAKYSYQSLYVKRPEMYLEASMRTSGPGYLADSLSSPADIFSWIGSNISHGSIFEDSSERIMTAEQVIVFQRGGLKDQAVLASILLKHKGYAPTVFVTRDNAYVQFEEGLFEAGTWTEIVAMEAEVELELTLDGPVEITRDVEDTLPEDWTLRQNYPNPFNAETDIGYQISDSRSPLHTSLKIYNCLGQEIRTLVDKVQAPGVYTVHWDGEDNAGQSVSTGVYLYRLQFDGWEQTKKMMLLK